MDICSTRILGYNIFVRVHIQVLSYVQVVSMGCTCPNHSSIESINRTPIRSCIFKSTPERVTNQQSHTRPLPHEQNSPLPLPMIHSTQPLTSPSAGSAYEDMPTTSISMEIASFASLESCCVPGPDPCPEDPDHSAVLPRFSALRRGWRQALDAKAPTDELWRCCGSLPQDGGAQRSATAAAHERR